MRNSRNQWPVQSQFQLSLGENKHGKLLFHLNISKLLTVKVFLTSVFLWWALWFHLGTQKPRYSQFPVTWESLQWCSNPMAEAEARNPQFLQPRCHPNSWSNSSFSSVGIACLGTLWFPVTSSQHQKQESKCGDRGSVIRFWPRVSQEVSLAYYHHSYVFCFLPPPLRPSYFWCHFSYRLSDKRTQVHSARGRVRPY